MRDWPDILDALGRTPREFGALHAHFEALGRSDGRHAVASLLLQGALEPMPEGGRVSLCAKGGGEVAHLGVVPTLIAPSGVPMENGAGYRQATD
jgi:hypothetical protein